MKELTPIFQAIIAFVAVLTGLGIVFNLLLGPIKYNQANMENRIEHIEKRMDHIEKRMEKRMDRIESKLDQLLSIKTASIK